MHDFLPRSDIVLPDLMGRTIVAIPEAIKAWAAGFYDGEGAVNISLQSSTHHNGTRYTHYRMRLQIGQVDPQPLKKLQSYWGGTIATHVNKASNNRTENRWVLRSRDAKRFMQDIYEYSQRDIVRRRFDVAMQFQDETSWNGNRPRSAAYIDRVEKLRLELKRLNARGLEGEQYEQPLPEAEADPQLRLLE